MPYFPLFIDLKGRSCIIVGGGPVAARKAETLLGFGAKLTVIAPEISEPMEALSPERLWRRSYAGPGDLRGACLAIAAADDRECNKQVSQDAKNAGIPVNAADDPALCTFYFPALVKRGELVGAISTSGGCPRLAGRLRGELETQWPSDMGVFLENLSAERKRLLDARGIRGSAETGESGDIVAELDRLITGYLKRE
jgi:siroheme synthase-like protein